MRGRYNQERGAGATYCDSHVARQEEVRSADLRKGFPEVSLPRPQLSYNRPGPAELGPAWLGSATPLLAQEKLGATGASPSLLSCLTFCVVANFVNFFTPHFLTSFETKNIPYGQLSAKLLVITGHLVILSFGHPVIQSSGNPVIW